MDSRDLTEEQRARLIEALERHRSYFSRLSRRMKGKGWYVDSPVINAVEAAWQATSAAINALRIEKRMMPAEDLRNKPFALPPNITTPPPADARRGGGR